jgi:APA family basic amino acid/polyamine antiporter
MAHLAVIGMRLREPDVELHYRIPLSVRVAGREIPALPAVGGLATLSVFVLVVVTREFGRFVGLGWMLAGLAMYYWYRRRERLTLFETVRRTDARKVSG